MLCPSIADILATPLLICEVSSPSIDSTIYCHVVQVLAYMDVYGFDDAGEKPLYSTPFFHICMYEWQSHNNHN